MPESALNLKFRPPCRLPVARHDTAAQSAASAGGPLGTPSYASDPAVQRMLLDMQRQLQASDQRKRRRNRKAVPRPAPSSTPAAASPTAASNAAGARHQRKRKAASQAAPKRHQRSGAASSDCADICGGGSTAQPGGAAAGSDGLRPNGTAMLQRLQQPASRSQRPTSRPQQPPGFQQRLPPDLRGSAHAAEWAAAIDDYRRRTASDSTKPAVATTPAAPAAAGGPAEAAAAAVASAAAAAAAAAHCSAVGDASGTLSSLAQQWRSPLLLQPALAAPIYGVEQHRQPMHLVCPSSALLAAAISGAQVPALQLQQPPPAAPVSAGSAAGAAAAGGLLQQHQATVAAAVAAARMSSHQPPPPLSLAAVFAQAAASARMPAASLCDTLQRLSSSHLSASSSGSGQWQLGHALADRSPSHPAAAAASDPALSWHAKRQRTASGRKQHPPSASMPPASPGCMAAMQSGSRKQLAAAAGGRSVTKPFVWREPRRLGKRGWARLLRASLVALPLRHLLDLVVSVYRWNANTSLAWHILYCLRPHRSSRGCCCLHRCAAARVPRMDAVLHGWSPCT